MKLAKRELTLEKGLTKEWLLTNGIGGFACSTVLGANTRKYHGLLVAPLTPPARRYLMLSKVDESITIGEKEEILYTNIGKQYISEGYKKLKSFEKEYVPVFTYQVGDILIEKTICMQYGKNTVCLLYHVKNGENPITLKLAPLINFRDFHQMSTNHDFKIRQKKEDRKVKIVVDDNSPFPLYMYCSEGSYIEHHNDTFENMYYIEEEKRGFYPEENHCVVGRYEIQIKPKEEKEISFIFSMEENIEEIQTKQIIEQESKRLNKIIQQTDLIPKKRKTDLTKEELKQQEILKTYIIATDNFVVNRPSFGLHTIIAGYPWFLDWGRDSLISFEGLLLKTKRFAIAREVLLTFMKDIKFGLVPNGYSGYDNRPLYNSVDASLLLFEQVEKYIGYTLDYSFVKENLYPNLVKIISSYAKGIDLDDNNIYLDKDGLLVSGTENTQNTWMDAKVNGFAVTPRNGKAVEINSLWYNALKIMEKLTSLFQGEEKAKQYAELADKCQKAFRRKFYNKEKKGLYDVLGDGKIRPNQLFSISLTYPVLDPTSQAAKQMLQTVKEKLLNPYGLKTLAKGEKGYIELYSGDSFKRDSSYHQGITWPWLLGLYYDGLEHVIVAEKTEVKRTKWIQERKNLVQNIKETFEKQLLKEGCLGSIAELYDSKTPHLPKGAIAQAWSVAEVFRILLEETQKEQKK